MARLYVKINTAGKPQNRADNPRASFPSERSNSALGGASGMKERMKGEG